MAENQPTRIVRRRLRLGLSQADIARRLEVTRETVSRIEVGEVWPNPDRITQLARILEVSRLELVEELMQVWQERRGSPWANPKE
jgi:ribosome-binding protein aMBF1 (putative translation factor)